ncbi:MAG: 3-methyl-2-oxobutanoate dehydrogenase subunit VorB [Anaerolineae bacterium]|nr:3-methyl-2-oxobutanoate dehydrogenase subunit VorB [Anaerolineae bacterium]
MAKELWEGNAAIAEAAVRAGLEAFFGYPITPQTEILEYLSRRLPELGRVFLQTESESRPSIWSTAPPAPGPQVMTSSSTGISLMQEGFSYIACSEVPAVVINVMRGGPGLGNVAPSQGDYFQAVKMAGHGDFHPIVLAPGNIQEAIDLTVLAFDLAEKYRTLAMVLADGSLGQMMEPAEMPPMRPVRKPEERPAWALTGAKGRKPNIISSLHLLEEELEQVNLRLQAKLREIAANETRWKEYSTEDADLLIVAFGTVGRVCQTVVREARAKGLKVGLLRPVTVWPFPSARIAELARQVRGILVVEMNAGQMLEDVRLAVEGRCPVRFYGRLGGIIPLPDEILPHLEELGAQVG